MQLKCKLQSRYRAAVIDLQWIHLSNPMMPSIV